jgi:photolyase PhrII
MVLYWMRMAVRDHENPALDAAVAAANALGLPVLVYHAVSERYPFASDRHHTFILEGARDVSAGLEARGIRYVLHVERPGARGPMLAPLAKLAALVVTEDVPIPPLDAWTARLGAHCADAGVPLWVVDASCVVPMPLVAKRYDRAYAFRTASRRLASAALAGAWKDVAPEKPPAGQPLPFTPIDARALDDRSLASLVAECEIDHGVAPVRESRGGSRAGYARWDAFRTEKLGDYARRRNDPLLDGTSRLSPYLHYGHVSPLRIARETAQVTGAGPDKFLDELLVWREVAWHFAGHTPRGELETLEPLPEWARATLAEHAADPREALTMERLERGHTGDALWDACQRSLLAHGELHNNLRMTWGKALPAWSKDPEAARRALVELNHRYALDGRDPASYGGLYWCLGLFDRPFTPPSAVLGTLRPRPTAAHAARIDVPAYARHVARPTRTAVRRVAVFGGGVAGLACARTLTDHNVDVTVFDKGRSPGGRLTTSRRPPHTFDLGAQYFTARDPRFRRHVQSWLDDGVCAPWHGRIVSLDGAGGPARAVEPLERLVGTPDMNALARHLAADLRVTTGQRVDRIERADGRLTLRGTTASAGVTLGPAGPGDQGSVGLGAFDCVVLCLPADQAVVLLEPISARLATEARAVPLDPCFVVGLAAGPSDDALRALALDGAFIGREGETRASLLSWVARDSSKPGRPPGERWVLHASAAWSRATRDLPRAEVEAAMIAELSRLFNLGPLVPELSFVHRWGYARALRPLACGALFDEDLRVGLGGDWACGGRVEGAFLSGIALAGRVLGLPELPEAARSKAPPLVVGRERS